MEFLDIHSLLDGKRRKVNPPENIYRYYKLWIELTGYKESDYDFVSFVAGYSVGTNITLRERFLKVLNCKEKIFWRFRNGSTK